MSKKIKIVLIAICVALTFTGISIWGVLRSQNDIQGKTVVAVNGDTNKTLTAELSDFYPGLTKTFEIRLDGSAADDYVVTLNFRHEQGGKLEDYLMVVISTSEIKIEKTLKELLDGEEISLGKNADEIYISYTMPESVGNESQGTTANFYIDLTAKNDV